MAAKKQQKQFDNKGSDGVNSVSPLYAKYFDEEFSFLKELLMNSVKIENLGFYDEYFVKTQLFGTGYVGYQQSANRFLRTLPEKVIPQKGRLWKNGQFYNENNVSLGVHPYAYNNEAGDKWRILLANPSYLPLFDVLETYASLLADCRVTIKQNINACKTPSFWVTDDADFAYSVKQAIQSTLDGDPAVVTKKEISTALSTMKNETPYIADKIHQEYREILNEVMNRVGILTANTSKRERVQSTEVMAGVGQSIDSVYTIIDFWNKQVESYGLPFKMEFNGSLEELYTGDEAPETGEL